MVVSLWNHKRDRAMERQRTIKLSSTTKLSSTIKLLSTIKLEHRQVFEWRLVSPSSRSCSMCTSSSPSLFPPVSAFSSSFSSACVASYAWPITSSRPSLSSSSSSEASGDSVAHPRVASIFCISRMRFSSSPQSIPHFLHLFVI